MPRPAAWPPILLPCLAALLAAQTNPPAAAPRPAAPKPAAPSLKDLKYAPLAAIRAPKADRFTLPNGMRLLLIEDHELPAIFGSAMVRTGNLFDPPGKVGLANMTGLLLRLGGTRAKTAEQLDEQLENFAATVESGIGESSGSVSFAALRESAGEVLAVFKDVLTSPEFRQEKIDLVKSQMRNNLAHRNDNSQAIVERELANTLLGRDTPYGWQEDYAGIDRIVRGDLQSFYQRYFFPANVILAVRGDFVSSEMKSRLEKLFSDWTVAQPPVPEFPKPSPPPPAGTWLALKKGVTQTLFAIGMRASEIRDPDYPALAVMAEILGGGPQSRLVQRLRYKMAAAEEVSAHWGANYDHPGLFQILLNVKTMSTVEAIKAIREEIERMRTAEVTDEELKSARDRALDSLAFASDSGAKALTRALSYEYFGYPADFLQQHQNALAGVTRAAVLRAAKEHLDPAKLIAVTVGQPEDFGPGLEALGAPVNKIDIAIAPPKREAAPSDAASQAQGKAYIERMQQAAGGVDKLAAVKDATQAAEFQLIAPGGGRVKVTQRWLASGAIRQESESSAGWVKVFWDGKYGWMATPRETAVLNGPLLKQIRGDLFRMYYSLLLSDRLAGRTVNAVDNGTVEISDPSGEVVRIVCDPESGLPSRLLFESVNAAGPSVSVSEQFSDFRDVAGVRVPYKMTITQGGQKFADMVVTDLRVNTGIKVEELQKRP